MRRSTLLSASWEAREDVGGNGLDLVALVRGVADGIHQKIAAARCGEAIELLDTLRGRADDAVLAGERPEVLRIAPAEPLDPAPLGALVVTPHGDEREMRGHEPAEGSTRSRSRRADLVEALPVAIGLDDVGHPAIPLPPRARQRGVGPATDPDGRRGTLHGLGIDAHALKRGEAALEGRGRIAPERAHHLDPLR